MQDLVSNRLQRDHRREVAVRVFVFSGAGDMAGAWGDVMRFAPPFAEIALHEWPSHGIREDEPPCERLDDLAKDAFKGLKTALAQHAAGGALEGAPFALIGHSVGCLLMVEVAALLRRELGLEPVLAVALDRVAPHTPMFTKEGLEKMQSSPDEFMRLYNGEVYRCSQAAGGERGQRMLRMWVDDVRYANEVQPVGFHVFECDLLVLMALHNAYIDQEIQVPNPDPEKVKAHAERDRLMNSSPGSAMDYDFEQFDGWKEWTSGTCTIRGIDTDHLNIKSHPTALDMIYEALRAAIDKSLR